MFSFGLIADVQYADKDRPPGTGRHYRQALRKLEACVADLNTRDLAFTVQLGDLIDGGRKDLEAVLAVYGTIRSKQRHVLGNHDFCMPRPTLLSRLGMKRAYYDFAVGSWRFVVLDAMDVSLAGWPKDSDEYRRAEAIQAALVEQERPNAASFNGGVGDAQMRWFRSTLAAARKTGQTVVVFCHLPAVADSSRPGHLLWNHEQMVEALESFDCVKAYFAGHDHRGGYAVRHGIHHVTVQGMVEGPRTNAYAVVDVHGDHLDVHGVGTVPSCTLKVEKRCQTPFLLKKRQYIGQMPCG